MNEKQKPEINQFFDSKGRSFEELFGTPMPEDMVQDTIQHGNLVEEKKFNFFKRKDLKEYQD